MSPQLSLEQQNQLALNPRLLLGVKLLQLPLQQLLLYARQAAETNPLLEFDFAPPAAQEGKTRFSPDEEEQDEEYRYSSYSFDRYGQQTLAEYLEEQLLYSPLCPEEQQIGLLLIASLDSRGYFCEQMEPLARRLGFSAARGQQVLALLRQFDPPGVAAVDLADCLCRQLDANCADTPLLRRLICDHLADLAQGEPGRRRVLEALQCSQRQLAGLLQTLRTLSPIPAQGFATESATSYIVADWLVEPTPEGFRAVQPEEWQLYLRQDYQHLCQQAKEAADQQALHFLHQNKAQAEQLLQAVTWRKRTLGLVAAYITQEESDFFRHGLPRIKPLTLTTVADALSLHPATISRAISHKYLQTPQGLLAAKYFFHPALNDLQGCPVSTLLLKEQLKELITGEDPQHPYSDQALSQLLLSQSQLPLARRTVAKYRQEAGLPPAAARRKREK